MQIKRSLAALAVVAGGVVPTAILLAPSAHAQVTKGAEAITATVNEVGTPASNPTMSVGGGTFSAGGTVVGKGNIADLPDGNVLLAFNNGTGTIELTSTGGRFVVANLNNVNCKFIANLINAKSNVASGTGIYSKATANLKLNLAITGTLPRNATGGCNTSMTSVPVVDVVKATAVGNINLHNA